MMWCLYTGCDARGHHITEVLETVPRYLDIRRQSKLQQTPIVPAKNEPKPSGFSLGAPGASGRPQRSEDLDRGVRRDVAEQAAQNHRQLGPQGEISHEANRNTCPQNEMRPSNHQLTTRRPQLELLVSLVAASRARQPRSTGRLEPNTPEPTSRNVPGSGMGEVLS